jgi:hypothetical protein
MTTPGLEIDFTAKIAAALGGVAGALGDEAQWRARKARAITQVPFWGSITLIAGAGTEDQPDKLQAKTGYVWGIRRLTVSGFTAGSVTVFLNSPLGEPIMTYPAAAIATYARSEQVMMPGDRLILVATGITGTVNYWGRADCMESWYFPHYQG